MCLVSRPPFSHAVAGLMLVLPNEWVLIKVEVKWYLYVGRQPVKGTGENKKEKTTLCSDRLLHALAQKVTKCGIKFDHRFASRTTSNQMPKC